MHIACFCSRIMLHQRHVCHLIGHGPTTSSAVSAVQRTFAYAGAVRTKQHGLRAARIWHLASMCCDTACRICDRIFDVHASWPLLASHRTAYPVSQGLRHVTKTLAFQNLAQQPWIVPESRDVRVIHYGHSFLRFTSIISAHRHQNSLLASTL